MRRCCHDACSASSRRGLARARALPLLALMGLEGTARAAPAPWYWWRSKVDGARACAQVSAGRGLDARRAPSTQCPGGASRASGFVIHLR